MNKIHKNTKTENTSKIKEITNNTFDIDTIVKNNETRNAINNIAKNIIENTNCKYH